MIDRNTERDLPAQIPAHALHRLLITGPGPVLSNITFASNDGGIDGLPILVE